MRFTRSEGLGNDYIILEQDSMDRIDLDPDAIRLLCDRHRGIGGDGILVPAPSVRADFGVRIFNPDGSEAEKSGNGLRIFARYLHDVHGATDRCSIETLGGLTRATFQKCPDGTLSITVDMGKPEFQPASIPFRAPGDDAVDVPLNLETGTVVGTAVSMGNPHWVIFCDDVGAMRLSSLGPAIEHHPRFPNRTNVQVAQVVTRGEVKIRIWERGVGETMASGSSACAVVAAGIRSGRLDTSVDVRMPGGTLRVSQDSQGHVLQTGPVNVIATGVVAEDLVRQVRALTRD